jgi:hypothetical protein
MMAPVSNRTWREGAEDLREARGQRVGDARVHGGAGVRARKLPGHLRIQPADLRAEGLRQHTEAFGDGNAWGAYQKVHICRENLHRKARNGEGQALRRGQCRYGAFSNGDDWKGIGVGRNATSNINGARRNTHIIDSVQQIQLNTPHNNASGDKRRGGRSGPGNHCGGLAGTQDE